MSLFKSFPPPSFFAVDAVAGFACYSSSSAFLLLLAPFVARACLLLEEEVVVLACAVVNDAVPSAAETSKSKCFLIVAGLMSSLASSTG